MNFQFISIFNRRRIFILLYLPSFHLWKRRWRRGRSPLRLPNSLLS